MTISRRTLLTVSLLAAPVIRLALTTTASDDPVTVIASGDVAELTGEATELWFTRMTFEPGSSLPADTQLGPTLVAVESGSMTITSDMGTTLVEGGASATPQPTGDVTIGPGQAVIVPAGATLSAVNDGTGLAATLVFQVVDGMLESVASVDGDADSGTGDMSGIEVGIVSVGATSLSRKPGTIAIERVTIAAGATWTDTTGAGAEAGGIEAGDAEMLLEGGAAMTWPGIGLFDPMAQEGDQAEAASPVDVTQGDPITLVAGDGYALGTDTAVTWNGGATGTTLLRAVLRER